VLVVSILVRLSCMMKPKERTKRTRPAGAVGVGYRDGTVRRFPMRRDQVRRSTRKSCPKGPSGRIARSKLPRCSGGEIGDTSED
jgi:hypothetical protein